MDLCELSGILLEALSMFVFRRLRCQLAARGKKEATE